MQAPIFAFSADLIKPGSQSYNSPGSFTFTVPKYKKLVVQLWGGGGSGAELVGPSGNSYNTGGGDSSFWGRLFAYGGAKGIVGYNGSRPGGAGGSFAGGDGGEAGSNGGQGWGNHGGDGGRAGGPGGGATAVGVAGNGPAGNFPGGGGAGGSNSAAAGSGGGGGGYCIKTYTFGAAGSPAVGDVLPLVVGAGGTPYYYHSAYPDGGPGASGRVLVSWS